MRTRQPGRGRGFTRWSASLQIPVDDWKPLTAHAADAEYSQRSEYSPHTHLLLSGLLAHFTDKETEACWCNVIPFSSILGLEPLVPRPHSFLCGVLGRAGKCVNCWDKSLEPQGAKIPAPGLSRAPPTQTTKSHRGWLSRFPKNVKALS